MDIDLENLDITVRQFEAKAEAIHAKMPDLDQDALDELVTGMFSGIAARHANEGNNPEAAHDAADAIASGINNEGPLAQIATILALGMSEEQIEEAIAPEMSAPGV